MEELTREQDEAYKNFEEKVVEPTKDTLSNCVESI